MEILLINDMEVAEMLGVSKRQVHRLRDKDGNFPKPVKIGAGSVRWKVSDIHAYVAAL